MSQGRTSQQRRHPRFAVVVRIDVQIRIFGSVQLYLFRTLNLSQSGMSVESVGDDPRLETHTMWEACLFLPRRDGGADKVQCVAQVVHKTSESHYGLKFVNIDRIRQNTLNEFLERVAEEGPNLGP